MNTLKTAVVVIVLLGIGYGVWMVATKRATPATLPLEVAEAMESALAPPDFELGELEPGGAPSPPGIAVAQGMAEAPPYAAGQGEAAPRRFGPAETTPDSASKAIDLPQIAPGSNPSGSLSRDPFPTPGVIPGADLGLPADPGPNSPGDWPSRFDGLAARTAARADRGFPDPGGRDVLPKGTQSPLGDARPVSKASAVASGAFDSDWRLAMRQLQQRELANALETLSVWCGSPDLSPQDDARLQELLDQLAGTVIYSTQHLIKPAHVVKVHERLQDIADQYHVPSQLLANINGISDPDALLPGQRLKVVPGPFTARVDVERQQIVLYARRHYAGRFFFTPGRDQPPRTGDFEVVSKMVDRTWYDRSGRKVPPEHPENPYGPYWIGLGSDQSIHGLASAGDRGCIGLTPRDAEDLYAILSVGSEVKIR